MNLKGVLKKIITDRDFQLTIILFGVGFLLAAAATYPTMTEDVKEGTVGEGDTDVEVFFPVQQKGSNPLGEYDILQNATLEVQGSSEDVNASIIVMGENEKVVEDWEYKGDEDKSFNIYEEVNRDIEYIQFKVHEGELSYEYTVSYLTTYSSLSFLAYILMVISLIFLFRFLAHISFGEMSKEERKKFEEDQKKLKEILEDRK